MSDISNVSSRSGQSATANPSTTGYSPLAQNVEDAASAPAGANQSNRSGALGRDATEKLTGALNKQVSGLRFPRGCKRVIESSRREAR
jgi:hypothetical protein